MTIAFSNKYDIWTTRYSFEPTCYAHVGNTLLSSKDNGLYKHDSNEARCNFYGIKEGCSLEVASNQDPSAIKSFNSISLETNISDWSASVFSNDEYDDANKQESQITAGKFVTREGFQYAEIPVSVINSSRNIFPAGNSNVDSVTVLDATGTYTSHRVNFLSPIAPGLPSSSTLSTQGQDAFRIYKLVSGENNFTVEDIIPGASSYCIGVGLKSIDIHFNVSGIEGDAVINAIGSSQLVVESNAVLDGDKMRGPYARIKLATTTTKPLELHAVNVDYSFSNLDSRLTQNS